MGVNQKYKSPPSGKVSFSSQGNLDFNIKGSVAPEFDYGAVIKVDLRRDKSGSENLLKEMYGYLSRPSIGEIQLGEVEGTYEQIHVDGTTIMGGTGGFNGKWSIAALIPTGVVQEYIPHSTTRQATKVVYASPVFEGLQLVSSYTPHSKLWGTKKRNNENKEYLSLGNARVFEAGLSYGVSFEDTSLTIFTAGAIGVSPDIKEQKRHPIKTWQIGFLGEHSGFQIGAGYINNQKSGLLKTEQGNAGHAYNLAVGYDFGPHKIAIGYMGSRRKVLSGQTKADVGSITYERSIIAGLSLFAEANIFSLRGPKEHFGLYDPKDYDDNKDKGYLFFSPHNKNNSGSVFLLGTKIKF